MFRHLLGALVCLLSLSIPTLSTANASECPLRAGVVKRETATASDFAHFAAGESGMVSLTALAANFYTLFAPLCAGVQKLTPDGFAAEFVSMHGGNQSLDINAILAYAQGPGFRIPGAWANNPVAQPTTPARAVATDDAVTSRVALRQPASVQPTSCPWCKPADMQLIEFTINPSAPSAHEEGEQ